MNAKKQHHSDGIVEIMLDFAKLKHMEGVAVVTTKKALVCYIATNSSYLRYLLHSPSDNAKANIHTFLPHTRLRFIQRVAKKCTKTSGHQLDGALSYFFQHETTSLSYKLTGLLNYSCWHLLIVALWFFDVRSVYLKRKIFIINQCLQPINQTNSYNKVT